MKNHHAQIREKIRDIIKDRDVLLKIVFRELLLIYIKM